MHSQNNITVLTKGTFNGMLGHILAIYGKLTGCRNPKTPSQKIKTIIKLKAKEKSKEKAVWFSGLFDILSVKFR